MPTPYKLKILNGMLKLKTFSDHVLSILGIKDLGTQTGDVTNGYVDWSIQHLTQTTAQWNADTTTILLRGQLGIEDTGNTTFKIKIGNGIDLWSALGYAGGSSSSVWGGITGTLSDQTDLQNALNNKQDLDSDLTAIAGLTPSNDDIIQRKAGSWINRTLAQLWVDLKDLTVTLTNKTLAVASNSITGTASRVAQFGAGGSLEASSVTTTQLSYLDATSSIQTQLNNRITKVVSTVTDASLTGTTAETYVYGESIPANTYTTGDIISMYIQNRKTGTAGNLSVRVYINTTNNLSGTPIRIAQYNSGVAANVYYGISRLFLIKSATNTESINTGISVLNSVTNSSTAASSSNIDWTIQQYLVISLNITNATDTGFLSGLIMRKE